MTTRPGTRNESRLNSRGIALSRECHGEKLLHQRTNGPGEKEKERKREGWREARSQKLQRNALVYIRRMSFFMNSYFLLNSTKILSREYMLHVFNKRLFNRFKPYDARSADFHEYRSSLPLHPLGAVKCLSPGVSHTSTNTS